MNQRPEIVLALNVGLETLNWRAEDRCLREDVGLNFGIWDSTKCHVVSLPSPLPVRIAIFRGRRANSSRFRAIDARRAAERRLPAGARRFQHGNGLVTRRNADDTELLINRMPVRARRTDDFAPIKEMERDVRDIALISTSNPCLERVREREIADDRRSTRLQSVEIWRFARETFFYRRLETRIQQARTIFTFARAPRCYAGTISRPISVHRESGVKSEGDDSQVSQGGRGTEKTK